MFNPPHPASILREDIFPELGITVTEAAKQLGGRDKVNGTHTYVPYIG